MCLGMRCAGPNGVPGMPFVTGAILKEQVRLADRLAHAASGQVWRRWKTLVRRRAGFTLIELLVVIAIIAVLAAILFPVFASAREKARSTTCLNNMGQLAKSMRMYVDSWNRYPSTAPFMEFAQQQRYGPWVYFKPTGVIKNPPDNWNPGFELWPEKSGIWPYVRTRKVFVCPSDISEPRRHFGLSYSMSWWYHRQLESSFARPARTVMLVDEGAGKPWPIIDGNFGAGSDTPADIHVGGCNFAYGDGHASWCKSDRYSDLLWRQDGVPGFGTPKSMAGPGLTVPG